MKIIHQVLDTNSLKLLFVAATATEGRVYESVTRMRTSSGTNSFNTCEPELLITGIGAVATAWALTSRLRSGKRPSMVINLGIAGSYRNDIGIGEVVIPVTDLFADSGIDTPGGLMTLSEAGLQNPDQHPFTGDRIIAAGSHVTAAAEKFRSVNAVTVNAATGSEERIRLITGKFNPDIETMEGAAFFYVCRMERIPFLALRAVSNRVEPRDRNKWDIPLALANLEEGLPELIKLLC